MNRLRIGLLLAAVGCITAMFTPAGASASAVFNFDVENATYNTNPRVHVYKLDATKDSTVIVMRAGVEVSRSDFASGSTSRDFVFITQPGDVIEAYQPLAPASPPGIPPTDSMTVPDITVTASAGSKLATGTAEDGTAVQVRRDWRCSGNGESVTATRTPGAFSATFDTEFLAGDRVTAIDVQPDGDRVYASTILPGETPCITASQSANIPGLGPGEPYVYYQSPYNLSIDSLVDTTITSTRTVIRRGDAPLMQRTDGPATYWNFNLSQPQRPLPGDTIEVFRPAEATTPLVSWTIPKMSAIFDAEADRVSVRAPASSWMYVSTCHLPDCFGGADQILQGTKAGRTWVSFKNGGLGFGAGFGGTPSKDYDLRADDRVSIFWVSEDGRFRYVFSAKPGDLMPPAVTLRVPQLLILPSLGKVTVTSNEKAKAWLKLTVVRDRRLITIATGRGKLKVGKSKLGLKLKTRLSGRYKAKLRLTVKDAEGNKSTVVKKLKIEG